MKIKRRKWICAENHSWHVWMPLGMRVSAPVTDTLTTTALCSSLQHYIVHPVAMEFQEDQLKIGVKFFKKQAAFQRSRTIAFELFISSTRDLGINVLRQL